MQQRASSVFWQLQLCSLKTPLPKAFREQQQQQQLLQQQQQQPKLHQQQPHLLASLSLAPIGVSSSPAAAALPAAPPSPPTAAASTAAAAAADKRRFGEASAVLLSLQSKAFAREAGRALETAGLQRLQTLARDP